ncbi:hypothetical protein FHL15_004821 [Xylaria flabelliformis]|uniref:non-specific serine/threonine protein kinase n=1 Tax=Xylaria flabelliformis TaxID=2512241 RepID=A0A553I2D0_9PEZI|nr:hypothetical protein FHL15_004821 [Xylaria flabelliformis]
MATFRDAYTDYYDNGLKYELITEVSPKVWKIIRKDDRMEYLAQDVTDALFTDVGSKAQQLTSYGQLFAPNGENLLEQVKKVLNHSNLVSLVDCFALQFSNSGKVGRDQWFTVWDYCDAGNLGNLLVPPAPRPQDPHPLQKLTGIKISGVEDVKMEDLFAPKFLPESFCWHVLTSVLKALMWLHDGVRDVGVAEDNTWQPVNENLDWQPMLHRNIHPQNIFIGYPRRREWYGPVKLGNYGQLHISGHCQFPGDQHAPTSSKAIGPPQQQKSARLEDLIAFDTNYGSIYPQQAMMVEPRGSKHMKKIQSQTARENLQDLDYTGYLKNFLIKIMEFDPWAKAAKEGKPNPIYVTSDLYCEALEGVQWFMSAGGDEVDSYVTSYMADADDYLENKALKASQLLDSFENVKGILEQFADKT